MTENDPTKMISVDLIKHSKDLESFLFTKMNVKTEAYVKLLIICSDLKTTPGALFENFVEDCYQYFLKKKERKEEVRQND